MALKQCVAALKPQLSTIIKYFLKTWNMRSFSFPLVKCQNWIKWDTRAKMLFKIPSRWLQPENHKCNSSSLIIKASLSECDRTLRRPDNRRLHLCFDRKSVLFACKMAFYYKKEIIVIFKLNAAAALYFHNN